MSNHIGNVVKKLEVKVPSVLEYKNIKKQNLSRRKCL